MAGPSFVLVIPESVSPDPAALGVGGGHTVLALSPDRQTRDCSGPPQAEAARYHKRWETKELQLLERQQAGRALQADYPSIFLCSPRQRSGRWDSASLTTRCVPQGCAVPDPSQSHVTCGHWPAGRLMLSTLLEIELASLGF